MGNRRGARARGIESGHRSSKLQSAMEYLMTYGWAILIIAIVLVALFSLGVFNSANFAPKAPPGSCQVFRPNGPGTTFDLNLEGECNGELPQYVVQLNGIDSNIKVPYSAAFNPNTSESISVAAWFKASRVSNIYPPMVRFVDSPFAGSGYTLEIDNGALTFWVGSLAGWGGTQSYTVSLNQYYFAVGTYDNSYIRLYVNGAQVGTGAACVGCITPVNTVTPLGIGIDIPDGRYFPGQIADVQLYNKSLSQNDIQTLYQEGIGGAPIDLQNLVGWWPLNGNANDYSGNQNNGAATNAIYTTSWTNGYTAP